MKAIIKNPMFYFVLIELLYIFFRYLNNKIDSFAWGLIILLFSQIIVLIITVSKSKRQYFKSLQK
ncbi:MAG: hypothetical protein K0R59_3202 [Sphingobacterium sp.]|jgi:tryptophan-rich sensory protein|nr:hypothetical protein [Sphingobacterium sp.]